MKWNDIDSYTTRFHELAKLVPHLLTPEGNRVDRYVLGLSREIKGNVTSTDPKTLQEAVNLATRINNNANRLGTFASDKAKGKRKVEEPTRKQLRQRAGKEQRMSRNYGIQAPMTEKGRGAYTKCLKCNRTCHVAKDCRVGEGRACFDY